MEPKDLRELNPTQLADLFSQVKIEVESRNRKLLKTDATKALKDRVKRLTSVLKEVVKVDVPVTLEVVMRVDDDGAYLDFDSSRLFIEEFVTCEDVVKAFPEFKKKIKDIGAEHAAIHKQVKKLAEEIKLDEDDVWGVVDPQQKLRGPKF